jgi:putative solute:sodium symporter small subunit
LAAVRPARTEGRCEQEPDRTRGRPRAIAVHQEEGPAMQLTERHREYWSKNLAVTSILLFIWFLVTFVLMYFARDLSFNFFGWTFAFYMAAQGTLIIYVVIIWYYARYMNELDQTYDVHEGED